MLGQNPLKILSITPPRKAYSLLVESRNGISIVIDSQLIVATMMEKLIFPLTILIILIPFDKINFCREVNQV